MTVRKSKMIEQEGCSLKVVHLDRVRRARQAEPAPAQMERLAALYKAMGDPNRLRMLLALRDGEMCVCDLAALTGISDSAVSHALRRLRDLALVKNRRDGQILYYSLDDHHVAELLDSSLDHLNH
ncbi:MAG: metalloregulator ArsR/SmtB family transcription factor [Desulfarculaceae bacterium]|nr:metalloregulator ArsR/SmtB family transcription factor [Desulfarculaceae bacterium]MCF8072058.1 metalloregulator ArsR/SmtB family transcription factor [Desulfarculaceae bacterium]MCF8101575.1 metalloregulator ArsR/SmtB family transcription factor [Desulfarculaceae bacterium]MCF8115125.1 metalloregulator ArsR/SmtB family transcription factor [Desulfarculaceae bacterium]